MQARLITKFKNITPEGGVIELVVWKVPAPVPPTEHGYKYRAVYALNCALLALTMSVAKVTTVISTDRSFRTPLSV